MAKKMFLVVDEPDTCDTCPVDCPRAMYGEDNVPLWCPLRPIPETQSSLNGVSDAWKEGWNACINAICGLDVLSKRRE